MKYKKYSLNSNEAYQRFIQIKIKPIQTKG